MAIRAITKFTTSDGIEHDTRLDAQKHEAMQKGKDRLATLIAQNAHLSTDHRVDVKSLIHAMAHKPEVAAAFRDAFNKVLDFHRNYGKLKAPKSE